MPLDLRTSTAHHEQSMLQQISCKEVVMRARFLGTDPDSQVDNSPTLFVTDRTDRRTFIAQGWKVTDPEALADVGPVPDHEAIIERYLRMCSSSTCVATKTRRASTDHPAHRAWPGDPAALLRVSVHGLPAGSP